MSKVIKAHTEVDIQVRRLLLPEPEPLDQEEAEEPSAPNPEGAFAPLLQFVQDDSPDEAPASSAVEGPEERPPAEPGEAPELQGAEDEAEAILAKAREEADAIVARARELEEAARRRAEEAASRGYEEGFQQGRKDGEEMGRRELEVAAQRLNKLISSLESQGNQYFSKYEAQLVKLVMEAVRQVVMRQIELDPSLIIDVIKQAFQRVVEGSKVTIRLSPKDMELVTELLSRDHELVGAHTVDVVPDSGISPGGCLVETEFGLVDATVETRLDTVRQEMARVLKERTGVEL